jgi:hypothetical protein
MKIQEIKTLNKTREGRIACKLLLARLDDLFIHVDEWVMS